VEILADFGKNAHLRRLRVPERQRAADSRRTGMVADYIVPGVVVVFIVWRILSVILVRRRLPALLREGAQVVDVRSPTEFASGHAPGSVNIPLHEIGQRARELDPGRWVIVCCASGTRSAMARLRLRRQGFDRVLNAGSWLNLP
jgi:rhodanese-related sulfurtransferase